MAPGVRRWFAAGGLAILMGVARVANAGGESVTLTVDDGHGVYRVHGAFTAPVSSAVAWAVLTDYDHIGAYVKSVRTSEVERRGDGWLLLRQDARGGVFPLQRTVHVLLDVREQNEKWITFSDLMGRDFRHYEGEWTLQAGPSGTTVSYRLEARPMAAIPHGIGRGLLGRDARDLLEQVRAEMVRRGRSTEPARAETSADPHATRNAVADP